MKRTIIIGDVHGTLNELGQLVDKLKPTRQDTLVFAGDLLDKGPKSIEVVKVIRGMRQGGYNIVLVLGNHEEKHERFRRAIKARNAAHQGDALPNIPGAAAMQAITQGLNQEDVRFLESATLVHHLPEHGAVVVHAGILPTLEELPTPGVLAAAGGGLATSLKPWASVLRVRYVTGIERTKAVIDFECDGTLDTSRGPLLDLDALASRVGHEAILRSSAVTPKGSFVREGEEQGNDIYWASLYDGRFGHVYFGHQPFIGASSPKRFPHATGLDLGCVFGNRLAAAVLVEGQEPQFVTVAAHKAYAKHRGEDEEG